MNLRYLQRGGLSRPDAIAAVALNTVAGAMVHVPALVVTAVLVGKSGVGDVDLPDGWLLLVGVVVLLVVAGGVLWTPMGRHRIIGPLRHAATQVLAVLRRPSKALELFGGSFAITACYVLCFAASLKAFGADVSFLRVTAVYLGASVVASAAPTPGGLGAAEAAFIAGLTALGTPTGPAVAGVLGFRLVTFWLPILPGWLTFRWLLRRHVI